MVGVISTKISMNYSLGASFSSSFDGKDGLMIVKEKRG